MNNKQSFVLYTSFYEPIKSLPNEELGLLFRAIFEFKENGVCNTDLLTPSSLMAFNFIKNQFSVDDAKYAKRAEANRNNGLKGGRPITQPNPNNPLGFSETQITQPNPNDNVNGNDNDKDNEKDIKKEKKEGATKKLSPLPVDYLGGDEGEFPMFVRAGNGWRITTAWELCDPWGEWAMQVSGYDTDRIILEADKFKRYFTSPNAKQPIKKDWKDTWMNWIYTTMNGRK